ncbi:MAG: 16S rRNA (cytosine(967)-C(5))-methyltransferase RsmB [Clostridiaceae bacterium]|jgi:16S rRNA (cytosine967-C5)-methyltransferase|nr:16S rRNA (cytosine(967)-C(5))-methyltransferase RsmB [Clostridiaceae bacterium]
MSQRRRHDKARSAKRERQDPARKAAVTIIREVTDDGAFSNESASRHLASCELDARDRAFVSAMVWGTLSDLPIIDYAISSVSKRPLASLEPWVRAILRAGVWQLYFSFHVPPRAACDESVRLTRLLVGKRATGFVNGIMRRLARSKPELPEDNDAADALLFGLPEELYRLFIAWHGKERAQRIGAWSKTSPPFLAIRPDLRRQQEFQTWLEGQETASWYPQCLLWPDYAHALTPMGRDVTQLTAYREGLFSLQSQSAMLAAQLLGARKKDRILDCCAAPGGKTAYLAEITGDEAEVTACDVSPERTDHLLSSMKRRGHVNVSCLCLDASRLPSTWDKSFDRVLCDVPCSGLGLLSKRPEIRSRVNLETIERLLPLQQSILRCGAKATAIGGTLIYSTCTLSPMENEAQIQMFLTSPEGREFALEDLTQDLPLPVRHMVSTRLPGAVLLMPPDMNSDGFFIARLRRMRT